MRGMEGRVVVSVPRCVTALLMSAVLIRGELSPEASAAREVVDTLKQVKLKAMRVSSVMSANSDVSTTGRCSRDIQTFCGFVNPGEGRLAKCLKEERDKQNTRRRSFPVLSDQCDLEIQELLALDEVLLEEDIGTTYTLGADLVKACRVELDDDVCHDVVKRYPGRIDAVLSCLGLFTSNISAPCKQELRRTKERVELEHASMRAIGAACQDDAYAYCIGVHKGEGRVTACLRKNRMRLSRHCWAELHCRQPIGDQPHRECKAEDHSTSGLGVAMSGALKPAWLAEDSLGGSESAEHEETVPHSIPTLPIWVLLCGAAVLAAAGLVCDIGY